MLQASFDVGRNLLQLRYCGHVIAQEVRRGATELQALLSRTLPGFRLLTDLSPLQSMDLDCVPSLNRMMDLCDKAGVDLVVRVIPDPQKDIGLNIMSLFHYRKRVRIVTCSSATEAFTLLDSDSPQI